MHSWEETLLVTVCIHYLGNKQNNVLSNSLLLTYAVKYGDYISFCLEIRNDDGYFIILFCRACGREPNFELSKEEKQELRNIY